MHGRNIPRGSWTDGGIRAATRGATKINLADMAMSLMIAVTCYLPRATAVLRWRFGQHVSGSHGVADVQQRELFSSPLAGARSARCDQGTRCQSLSQWPLSASR